MANIRKIIKGISDVFGFTYDQKRNIAYGEKQGFKMIINPAVNSTSSIVHIGVCAADADGAAMTNKQLEQVSLPKGAKISSNSYAIDINFPAAMKVQSNVDIAVDAAQSLLKVLIGYNAVNCDISGVAGNTEVYVVKGAYAFLTTETADGIRAKMSIDRSAESEKSENYIMGIVGAFVGSLAGVLLILLIARLGRISMVSGLVMGIAVTFMYKKFGGKFTKVSLVICSVVSIVMTYVAFRLDIAIDLFSVLKDSVYSGASFMSCFTDSKEFFISVGESGTYYHNLVLMMIMGCIGGIGAPASVYASEKEKFSIEKVS